MTTVVLCGGRTDIPPGRRILGCPVCKQRRRHVYIDTGTWYAPTITCCGCGDSWCDTELLERPFRRGWRRQAIADARADWERGIPFAQWVKACAARAAEDLGAGA